MPTETRGNYNIMAAKQQDALEGFELLQSIRQIKTAKQDCVRFLNKGNVEYGNDNRFTYIMTVSASLCSKLGIDDSAGIALCDMYLNRGKQILALRINEIGSYPMRRTPTQIKNGHLNMNISMKKIATVIGLNLRDTIYDIQVDEETKTLFINLPKTAFKNPIE